MLQTQFKTTDNLIVHSSVFRLIPSGAGISREVIQVDLGPFTHIYLTVTPGQVKIQVADPHKKLEELDEVIIRRKVK